MHPILSLAVVAAIAVPVAGCTDSPREATEPAATTATTPTSPAAGATSSGSAAPGSDADLPLPPAASVPAVDDVPSARVATLRTELASVWGVRLATAGDTLRGTGADDTAGVRFEVEGRASGEAVRGYACTAAPVEGSFASPAPLSGDTEPAPETMAALETALGFLQTCADSSAADPDRATVWVRAVAQQVLAGTPAERRIDGVRFRMARSGGGFRLAVGSV